VTKEEKLEFSLGIQYLAMNKKISHLEAVVLHCEDVGLEIEVAAQLIDETLKEKIEEEAKKLRYIQRTSELPL
jgi:hypothetical protein